MGLIQSWILPRDTVSVMHDVKSEKTLPGRRGSEPVSIPDGLATQHKLLTAPGWKFHFVWDAPGILLLPTSSLSPAPHSECQATTPDLAPPLLVDINPYIWTHKDVVSSADLSSSGISTSFFYYLADVITSVCGRQTSSLLFCLLSGHFSGRPGAFYITSDLQPSILELCSNKTLTLWPFPVALNTDLLPGLMTVKPK